MKHVDYEGPGCIIDWARKNRATVSFTSFYENQYLPEVDMYDWLVIMGGPMGVFDDEKFPWLSREKEFIGKAIDSNKTIIGICLGAQLLAEVMGAGVYQNKCKEIGWFPVQKIDHSDHLLSHIENDSVVFHWHADTFDLPEGADHLISSNATINQSFVYGRNIVGLQFHLEVTIQNIHQMVSHIKDDFTKNPFVQSREEISRLSEIYVKKNNGYMFTFLDKLKKVSS